MGRLSDARFGWQGVLNLGFEHKTYAPATKKRICKATETYTACPTRQTLRRYPATHSLLLRMQEGHTAWGCPIQRPLASAKRELTKSTSGKRLVRRPAADCMLSGTLLTTPSPTGDTGCWLGLAALGETSRFWEPCLFCILIMLSSTRSGVDVTPLCQTDGGQAL